MIEDEQDKLYRYLTRSTRDEVYRDIIAYHNRLSKRSKVNDNVVRKILHNHGWTMIEYARTCTKYKDNTTTHNTPYVYEISK